MAIPIPGGVAQLEAARAPVSRGQAARHEARAATGFLALSMAGFLAFTILPILGSLVMAFFDWPVFGDRSFVGLANFTNLLHGDPVFHRVLLNTVLFVVLYLPLNIVISMALAVWISPKVRGRGLYRVLFFLPAVTPMVANAIVWQLLLTPRGVIDGLWKSLTGTDAPNFLGSTTWAMGCVVVMSVWQGFGYYMLVFSAALDAVPDFAHGRPAAISSCCPSGARLHSASCQIVCALPTSCRYAAASRSSSQRKTAERNASSS